MTFWRPLEARAGALLGARGKAFVASMLRTYLASTLSLTSTFSPLLLLLLHPLTRLPKDALGIDVAFVRFLFVGHGHVSLFPLLPKVEPIAA